MTSFPVLTSCQAVVERGQFVQIRPASISQCLDNRPCLKIPRLPRGPAPYHYFDSTAVTAQWTLVLDTLNHCFWPDPDSPLWKIHYANQELSGYWALAGSLKRAMEEGIPLNQADTLANMKRETLAHIFRGSGNIPLFEKRLTNLQEVGQVLLDRFQGQFIHVLEEARGMAVGLIRLVAEEFPSFNDVATHHGETVYFFKRAQLLTHDLWCAFSGDSWGAISGLDQLTAFADYKLPQVLRHLGIIHYESELARRVGALELLPPGSPEEVEIRAATVCAVERLRQELEQRHRKVTAAQLDNWLWHLSQDDTYRTLPYHRTRTIFY